MSVVGCLLCVVKEIITLRYLTRICLKLRTGQVENTNLLLINSLCSPFYLRLFGLTNHHRLPGQIY